MLGTKRKRILEACTSCRQRRRKCDGSQPCTSCIDYGYECTYKLQRRALYSSSTNVTPSPIVIAAEPGNARQFTQPHINGQNGSAGKRNGRGFLDSNRGRYFSGDSSIVFPNKVATSFAASHPPRLHSFGWNLGVRDEAADMMEFKLRSLCDEDKALHFCNAYFDDVNSIYPVLDQAQFMSRISTHYRSTSYHKATISSLQEQIGVEAVATVAIALGSLFSLSEDHSDIAKTREAALIQYVKLLLDSPIATTYTKLDHVVTHVLLAIYARLTTRPHVSWLHSCNAIHLSEIIGLHQQQTNLSKEEESRRRNLFWIALSLNRFYSVEYGSSVVHLADITCRQPTLEEDASTYALCKLMDLLPTRHDERHTPTESLGLLAELEGSNSPIITLLKADVACCIYRILRIDETHTISFSEKEVIMRIGLAAIEATKTLTRQRKPWYHLSSTMLQYLCVLLDLGTETSIKTIPTFLKAIKDINHTFHTHMTREAYDVARLLIRSLSEKKDRELKVMQSLLSDHPDEIDTSIAPTDYFQFDNLGDLGAHLATPWLEMLYQGGSLSSMA